MRGYVRITLFVYALSLMVALPFGCKPLPENSVTESSAQEASMTMPSIDSAKTILFMGNIAAGFGLDRSESVPAVIQRKADSLGLSVNLINAGLSKETSDSGKDRIDFLLNQNIHIFVLELGINDQLENIPLEETRNNLQQIIDEVKKRLPDVQILLCGFSTPELADQEYLASMREMYDSLAYHNELTYLPDILDGIAEVPELIQADGIHPTAEGHARIARRVWVKLEHLLVPYN